MATICYYSALPYKYIAVLQRLVPGGINNAKRASGIFTFLEGLDWLWMYGYFCSLLITGYLWLRPFMHIVRLFYTEGLSTTHFICRRPLIAVLGFIFGRPLFVVLQCICMLMHCNKIYFCQLIFLWLAPYDSICSYMYRAFFSPNPLPVSAGCCGTCKLFLLCLFISLFISCALITWIIFYYIDVSVWPVSIMGFLWLDYIV